MNLEIAAQWTAALRSGKYKQTRNKLCDSGGFCCLGVLSEMYLATPDAKLTRHDTIGISGMVIQTEYVYTDDDDGRVSKDSALPRPAREWAGLKGDLGDLRDTLLLSYGFDYYDDLDGISKPESLADLNDSGLTFAQIADVIDYVAADL